MFNVNTSIKNIDNKIKYLEFYSFYEEMSKITNMDFFVQVMETKEGEEKRKIEEGLIYLSQQTTLKEYEKIFLEKYHQYLIISLESDIREYYNNVYCSYLYSKAWNDLSLSGNSEEVKFINGKTLDQIEDMLVDKNNNLINKIRNGEELEENDKRFLEENFLLMAYDSVIYKESNDEKDLMYDIVDYFKKYPIKDLSNPRNRQLDMLSTLASRMINNSYNCAIQFNKEKSIDDEGFETFGCIGNLQENGITCIKINGLDIYEIKTDKEYLKKMFTVYHELGHLSQEYDEFNDEFRQVIEMERYLIKNDREFYYKYHDSFMLERDADSSAIVEFIKDYGERYPEIVYDIVSKEQNRKRIDWPTFYLMELEEYGKIHQNSKQAKLHN